VTHQPGLTPGQPPGPRRLERPLPPRPVPPLTAGGFREFRRRHPGLLAALVIVSATMLSIDGWLVHKRRRYEQEIVRLRAGMDEFERRRSDALLASREKRLHMVMELVRRQAKWNKDIHLSVSVDSSRMYLVRAGAVLRAIPIEVGPERRIGTSPDTVLLATPRGTRSVQAVLGPDDPWEIPAWVYAARGLPAPPERTLKGALGPVAIVLDGGTVIYSMPSVGPLNDSSFLLPGSVRVRAQDLEAVVPNLTKGTNVYFY